MRQRVLVLIAEDIVIPDTLDDLERLTPTEASKCRTEYDVLRALEQLGHEVRTVGVGGEIASVRQQLLEYKPHVVFNLLEEFRGEEYYVPFLLGYLELMRFPYTGCNPSGLILADNKPLTKKLLRYHRIQMPDFALFPRGRRVRRPTRLDFPLIVKSTTVHGSVGIAQASIVHSDDKLRERVEFVHDQIGTDAMAEQYIEGRELYLGMLGNRRLTTFPLWELRFENLADGSHAIATEKAKWDPAYQDERGIKSGAAQRVPDDVRIRIEKICKRVYRVLGLNGYARLDLRLTEHNDVYLIEPNPNPDLAWDHEFAEAAATLGLDHPELVQRVINLGINYASIR